MLCMPEGVYQVKACYTVLSTAFLTVLFGHFDQYIAERDKLFEIHFTSSNITSSPGHIKVSNVHRIRNQSTNSWLGNRATGAADTHVFWLNQQNRFSFEWALAVLWYQHFHIKVCVCMSSGCIKCVHRRLFLVIGLDVWNACTAVLVSPGQVSLSLLDQI